MTDCMHDKCKGCPSSRCETVTRTCTRADIAIVYDWPTDSEIKHDRWFAGRRSGPNELMRLMIQGHGYDPDDIYVCSAVNCVPNRTKKVMQKNAMLACRERLLEELHAAGVERVLSVGPLAYSALVGSRKLLPISGIRGRWREVDGLLVMATIPPGWCYPRGGLDHYRDLEYDINKFFTTHGPQSEPSVELWIPETLAEVDEAFEWLREYRTISSDVETTGLSPVRCEVLAAGFCVLNPDEDTDATVVILDDMLLRKKRTWRRMLEVLNDPAIEVAFHNTKFDIQFFRRGAEMHGLTYDPRALHDTLLLHYALDERPIGKFRSHGLETLARVRYDSPDYSINVRKFLDEWAVADEYDKRGLRERLHVYLALDCYYTARLLPDLWNEAVEEDEQLLDLYESLLLPAMRALADIEYHGILLDRPFFERAWDDLQGRMEVMLARIRETVGDPEFNPGSPTQVRAYVYEQLDLPFGLRRDKDGTVYHTARRGGLQEGPTAAPVLKGLAYKYPEHAEIIEDICEYRNLAKNAGTYVKGLLQRCDVDERIRTSFNIAGTATGRLSSSNPNLQNVPDASHTGVEIRGGFKAPEGSVLIEADYKQLEVRIAAWLSDDDIMRKIFESGRDPHQEIAFSIYQKPKEEVTHYMRWLAKNILFGLLYGRGYESVATGPEQEDIAREGGQRWGIEEVKSFYDNLLAEWDRFAEWQASQKRLGYETGLIQMPTGRRRRFNFIPRGDGGYVGRASFNNPIQGTASDFTLYALVRLHEQLPDGAHIVLTVHDSICIECLESIKDEVVALVRHIMETDTLYEIDVPLLTDIDIDYRWGESEGAKQHVPIADVADMDLELIDA